MLFYHHQHLITLKMNIYVCVHQSIVCTLEVLYRGEKLLEDGKERDQAEANYVQLLPRSGLLVNQLQN